MRRTLVALPLLAALAFATPASAQAGADWATYRDPQFQYSVDIPLGLYTAQAQKDETGALTFVENGGAGQLTVFSAANVENLSVSEYADYVRTSGQIGDITYSRRGSNWFVYSGYSTGDNGEQLIYYTKFLFNADRSAFSGFEISYPVNDKHRYDPIVTRIEKSLRAPSSQL